MKPHLAVAAPVSTGIKPFDNLTREQQIAALYEVGIRLLRNQSRTLKRVAYRQATLLALFDCVERNIRLEILENTCLFRSLILAAHKGIYGMTNHGIDNECTDFGSWKAVVRIVRKKYVDEKRFEITDKITDLPREITFTVYQQFEIPTAYHRHSPGDPPYFKTVALAGELLNRCNDCLMEYTQGSLDNIRRAIVEVHNHLTPSGPAPVDQESI